ncbi:hypothetical protein [Desulfitobacterium chlororespirans]|uniref:PD-(D/E)XK nuclease superfamily protein n=1 Tax=Desulfitobacterium chlororespirans DSM 11544 TaxID=1121395 RepID=A0A1M7SCM5_9FIRM|nr:hypothetical protein [Desulfitobacterium chlororespirans]SHN56255.1 hypothetical protein SAMN02745215_00658 [Desulfitobacterium chlororespirans DSM 11544]
MLGGKLIHCQKALEWYTFTLSFTFYHRMSAFHELALYQFIDYMADLREEDMEKFDSFYFDKKCRSLISAAAKLDCQEDNSFSLDKQEAFYYDVFSYPDIFFTDLDFQIIPQIYNRRVLGDTSLEHRMGINIDFYFEIMPMDIQHQYSTNHLTLTGEVSGMLSYIEDRMHSGNLYKLFWENRKPVREDRIQTIMENIMDAYFYNQEIEITREALLGNGQVDFKLYRNKHEDEKILIEIKKANSPSYLKKGYEKQLTEYMLSSKYKNAFYLVACFTDEEYERVLRFIRGHIYTDTVQLYINISILDLRIRKSASAS